MKFIKKVILSSFFIYAFNMMAVNFNIVMPINMWTIGFVSLFDFIGFAVLLLIKISGG